MRDAKTLVLKAFKKPHRIPPFIYNNVLRPVYNRLKYALYRRREGIPAQEERIHNLVSQDEFALVILDACRFDFFAQAYEEYLRGDLQRVWSPANLTPRWLPVVWSDTYDATYVSANPNAGTYEYDMVGETYCLADHFTEVIDVWDFGWEFEIQATPPEVVTDVALEVAARDVETRLVVHYLQPHQPYCGEYRFDHWLEDADESAESVPAEQRREFLENTTDLTMEDVVKYEVGWGDLRKYDISLPERGVRQLIDAGEITDDELRRAYRSNLERVLPEVARLVARLDCPVVITADHGDLLGESDEYMHPRTEEVAHENLREVPWLVVDDELIGTQPNDADTTWLEEHAARSDVEESEVAERLAQLGYK